MRINGVDISKYGAEQHTVSMGYSAMSNASEWQAGDCFPLMLETNIGFKEISVMVILKGNSRNEIWRNGSDLIAALLKPCVINLDGFEHNYKVCIKNADQAEQSIKRWHKATLKLFGYEYANQKIAGTSKGTFVTVVNEGNMKAPAILEVTPDIGLVSVTVMGLCRDRITGEEKPIIIQNLTKNKMVVIDGETGLISERNMEEMEELTNKA